MNALFPYIGHKASNYLLLNAITVALNALQSKDKEYREPFLGAGGVFLNFGDKLPNGQAVWLNDLDSSVICLWKMVWQRPDDLLREAERLWNPSKKLFDCLNRRVKAGYNPEGNEDKVLSHAVATLIRQHYAWDGGKERTFSAKDKVFLPVKEAIYSAHRQLKRLDVRMTALHFEKVVSDPGPAFLYLDPPYFKKGYKNYRKYMKKQEHQQLRDLLLSSPNPWLLSYDDCSPIRLLYEVSERKPVLREGRERLEKTPGRTDEWYSLPYKSTRNNKTYRELLLMTPDVARDVERRVEPCC